MNLGLILLGLALVCCSAALFTWAEPRRHARVIVLAGIVAGLSVLVMWIGATW